MTFITNRHVIDSNLNHLITAIDAKDGSAAYPVEKLDAHIDVEQYNRDEVCDIKWLTIPKAMQQIRNNPENFTEWFKIYMTDHRQMFDALLCDSMESRHTKQFSTCETKAMTSSIE